MEPRTSDRELCASVLREIESSMEHSGGVSIGRLIKKRGDPRVESAIATLADQGRVVIRDGKVKLSLAQIELNEAVEVIRRLAGAAPPHTDAAR